MIVSKAGANLSGAPLKALLLPGFTQKHKTRLERLASDKHYTLLWTLVNYGCKKFYRTITLCYKFLINVIYEYS